MAEIELWLHLTYFSENRWEHLTNTENSLRSPRERHESADSTLNNLYKRSG
jgi:hypothetical protein